MTNEELLNELSNATVDPNHEYSDHYHDAYKACLSRMGYKEKLLALCRGLEIETPEEAVDLLSANSLEVIGSVIASQAKKSSVMIECLKEIKGLNQ